MKLVNNLEKTLEISELFITYKNLLTTKQVQYLELYIDEDWSLQEIADEFSVSKAAVYDSIKKTIAILTNFETQLKVNQKEKHIAHVIATHEHSQIDEVQQLIQQLKGD
ncbi:YlxM family DNA-binding protein [Williamsoniiplasma lucivorax]|uniref:YlxM family DNA-binding protein n=1 Tax=Williamsoniiplasma lucivorax TaxID=209274 RepID=UPI000482C841